MDEPLDREKVLEIFEIVETYVRRAGGNPRLVNVLKEQYELLIDFYEENV